MLTQTLITKYNVHQSLFKTLQTYCIIEQVYTNSVYVLSTSCKNHFSRKFRKMYLQMTKEILGNYIMYLLAIIVNRHYPTDKIPL